VTRWERWTFNLLALVVTMTGCAYLWMKYAMTNDDPFSVVNHPWQAPILDLHVLASPAFILMFGIIFNSHVMKKLRANRSQNRRSGLVSFGTFAVMVLSGYLLQVSSDEIWLRTLLIAHVTSGLLFSVAYAAHLVLSVKFGVSRQDIAVREVA
jgi:hypothetical protein